MVNIMVAADVLATQGVNDIYQVEPSYSAPHVEG